MENITSIICIELLSLLTLGFGTIIFYNWLWQLRKITAACPRLPPGPRGYPIFGSLPEMLKNKPTFRWIDKLMHELNTEIVCIRLGYNIHVIPITSPELAREFLKKQDAIFSSRPFSVSARLTSNGFLSAVLSPTGDQWKKMRRILVSEVLSTAMHNKLHQKRAEEADHLVRCVLNQCRSPFQDGLVNVRDATQHYCANLIRKLVFGRRFFGVGLMEGREHVDAMFTVLLYLYGFCIADYVPWLEVFDLDGHKRIVRNAMDSLRKYQDVEITERVEMWRNGNRKTEEDILDVLICLADSNNNPLLSIQEISAQVNEILLAAIDNPSNAVEWAMAEMLHQPDILEKACKEVDRVVGKERLVQEPDLPKLNYIKACVRESMRLHPVAPFNLPHVSTKDTIVGGYFIPKGSHVLLSRPGLGRNPRTWEDPLKYTPERHIIDEASEVVLVDFELKMLSFSTGRRGCPATVLGTTMSTMLLARLIQGFSWESPTEAPPINLVEARGDLQLAKPLIARAVPRLKPQVYDQLLPEQN